MLKYLLFLAAACASEEPMPDPLPGARIMSEPDATTCQGDCFSSMATGFCYSHDSVKEITEKANVSKATCGDGATIEVTYF